MKACIDSPSLPTLPLDMLHYIATFLVPEKSASKLSSFAEPRFFALQNNKDDVGITCNSEEQVKANHQQAP